MNSILSLADAAGAKDVLILSPSALVEEIQLQNTTFISYVMFFSVEPSPTKRGLHKCWSMLSLGLNALQKEILQNAKLDLVQNLGQNECSPRFPH